MEERPQTWKPQGGFWLAMLVSLGLIGIQMISSAVIRRPTMACLADSVVRVILGLLVLWLLVRFFDRDFCRRAVHGRNLIPALVAGAVELTLIAMMVYALLTRTTAADWAAFRARSWKYLFAKLFCLQLATGFFEEVTYRGLLLEGYWRKGEKTAQRRLIYGALSFLACGLLHVVGGGDFIRFIVAGTFGLAMAAVYLYSGNLLAPMALHFGHELLARTCSLIPYGEGTLENLVLGGPRALILLMVMGLWAVTFLLLPPWGTESKAAQATNGNDGGKTA